MRVVRPLFFPGKGTKNLGFSCDLLIDSIASLNEGEALELVAEN